MTWFRPSPQKQHLMKTLRAMPPESMLPSAQKDMRQNVMEEFRLRSVTPVETEHERPHRSMRRWFDHPMWAVAALAAVVILLGAGATIASASALPGQPLYGLAKAVDQVRIALASGPSAKADVATDIAVKRQEQATRLEDDDATPEVLEQAQTDANDALDTALSAIDVATTQESPENVNATNANSSKHRQNTARKVAERLLRIQELKRKAADTKQGSKNNRSKGKKSIQVNSNLSRTDTPSGSDTKKTDEVGDGGDGSVIRAVEPTINVSAYSGH